MATRPPRDMLKEDLELLPDLSFWYGLSFIELVNLPNWVLRMYAQALSRLKAELEIVHNRAVVNRTFVARLPSYPAELGQHIELEVDPVFDDVEFLATAVSELDVRAAAKFGLPCQQRRVTDDSPP